MSVLVSSISVYCPRFVPLVVLLGGSTGSSCVGSLLDSAVVAKICVVVYSIGPRVVCAVVSFVVS